MEPLVFFAVLGAAILHAGWNAVLKVGLDRFSSVLLLALVQALIAIPILPFVTQPTGESWIWIAGAAVLHSGYKIFLILAYRHGDLSQIYPIARGTAPLIVTIFSFFVLGEAISTGGLLAILSISGGVLLMSLKGGALGRMSRTALLFALGTACFTASYTLFDGVGARIAGTASGFILWMVIGDALLMFAYGAAVRGRAAFPAMLSAWRTGIAAGAMSLGSYWVAVWAFTQAPLALVAALRETSILFAVLIGVFILGERAGRWRWTAAGFIGLGVILMRV
jgi:drug/metabolite transporter (DMT)-like permease